MRTRKPNVTEKDFAIVKRLRAGGASAAEICELTGFSDSTIWNICKLDTFDDYVRMNVSRRKGAPEQEKIDPPKAEGQISVDDMIQASYQEKIDLLIDMVSEIGCTLARISDQLQALTGGKKA